MAWFGLFLSPPASFMAIISLVLRKSIELKSFEDSKDSRLADLDIMITIKIHRNLIWPKMISLAKIKKLGQDFNLRRPWTMMRPTRTVSQLLKT